MDLIQNYESDEEEQNTDPGQSPSEEPVPSEEPMIDREAAKKAKKKKKRAFRKKIEFEIKDRGPTNRKIFLHLISKTANTHKHERRCSLNPFQDMYQCNHCPLILSRKSLSRHISKKHPEQFKLKWQFNCTKVTKFKPKMTELFTNGAGKIIVGISWNESARKQYPIGDMLASKSIRAQLKDLQGQG